MLKTEYYTKPDGSKWVMITRYTQRKQHRETKQSFNGCPWTIPGANMEGLNKGANYAR